MIGSAPGAAGVDCLAAGAGGGLAPDGRADPLAAAGGFGPCSGRDGVRIDCGMLTGGRVEPEGIVGVWAWV